VQARAHRPPCIVALRPHLNRTTSIAPTATAAPVRVDVWSDFVCPFCLIGSLRLVELADKQPIETVWHAFMLRPPGSPGMTDEKHAMIAAYTPKISAQIRDEFGLDVRRGPIGAQTFAAHHAMKHAERSGQGAAFHDAVLRAYWLDGADIANHDMLRKIGERLDLALDDELLSGQEPVSAEAVQNDVDQAAAYNIHGVPAFIFGNRYFVSGAQPLALLERAADAARQGRTAVH
jgi:predicted DsbA family dithiol-disulfide isomerase